MNTDEDKLNALSGAIIGLAFKVHNVLGRGFAEKVYENALVHELQKAGLQVSQQHPVPVFYDGVRVGDYVADLIVERTVLVEIKAARTFDDSHIAQCLNYLVCTRLPLCLLMNFTQRVEIKRIRGPRHEDLPQSQTSWKTARRPSLLTDGN
ncbi:MAG: GxxExxY protein [Phycisphaerae bacterium]